MRNLTGLTSQVSLRILCRSASPQGANPAAFRAGDEIEKLLRRPGPSLLARFRQGLADVQAAFVKEKKRRLDLRPIFRAETGPSQTDNI